MSKKVGYWQRVLFAWLLQVPFDERFQENQASKPLNMWKLNYSPPIRAETSTVLLQQPEHPEVHFQYYQAQTYSPLSLWYNSAVPGVGTIIHGRMALVVHLVHQIPLQVWRELLERKKMSYFR